MLSRLFSKKTARDLELLNLQRQLTAIGNSQGVVEFSMDGHLITANQRFLDILGYSLNEALGKPHSTFVDAETRNSSEYRQLWERLRSGQYDAGVYKRMGKGGKEIWLQASYNPVLDADGKPCKVIKYATDITAQQLKALDADGQLAAIGKSQGVIEFNLDSTVITANQKFLDIMGYSQEEAAGKPHSTFVDMETRNSREYQQLWERLRAGSRPTRSFWISWGTRRKRLRANRIARLWIWKPAIAASISSFGSACARASTMPEFINALPKAAGKSGCRLLTIPSST
ncbi:methyl-accepting chemotaxis sensory transducer with Pas/Pac sensor [Methylovorus sp. MP688]|nr:methyl-accepting chemotaxis sensory transducer with Pas/Pac sensor [Methylovorus sp. MP688]